MLESPVSEADGFFVSQGFAAGDEVVTTGRRGAVHRRAGPARRGALTMLASLVRWSLDRPRLIAWACLWFLVWGGLSVRDIGFDLLPELAPAETIIQTEAPGLVAEQVENLVTRPIETRSGRRAGRGRRCIRSRSRASRRSPSASPSGADPYRVRETVSERLAGVAGALPAGVVAAEARAADISGRRGARDRLHQRPARSHGSCAISCNGPSGRACSPPAASPGSRSTAARSGASR